jgi:hypothetical protein
MQIFCGASKWKKCVPHLPRVACPFFTHQKQTVHLFNLLIFSYYPPSMDCIVLCSP